MPEAPKVVRKMNVIGCEPVYSGEGKQGPYTLYKVEALTEEGAPIEQELRSFDDLPAGLDTYEVEPYDAGPKHGMTFTLKPQKGKSLGKKVDELRERVDTLEKQVKYLLSVLPAEMQKSAPHLAAQPEPTTRDETAADARWGAEVPW